MEAPERLEPHVHKESPLLEAGLAKPDDGFMKLAHLPVALH